MAKTQIVKQKVEVVQKVRLTAKQRSVIDKMYANGGKSDDRYMDWGAQSALLGLKLIEKKPKHTPTEIAKIEKDITALWGKLSRAVSKLDRRACDDLLDQIQAHEHDTKQECWWLTKEGREYCEKGSVTIVR